MVVWGRVAGRVVCGEGGRVEVGIHWSVVSERFFGVEGTVV